MRECHTVWIPTHVRHTDEIDMPSASLQQCDIPFRIVIARLAIACSERDEDPTAIGGWECLEWELSRKGEPRNRVGGGLVTAGDVRCGSRSASGTTDDNGRESYKQTSAVHKRSCKPAQSLLPNYLSEFTFGQRDVNVTDHSNWLEVARVGQELPAKLAP